ncbi:MAG TPA: sulfotransferase [Rhodanobacteraceae bacterium]
MPDASTTDVNAEIAAARASWQRSDIAQAAATLRRVRDVAPAREDAALLLAEVLRSDARLSAAAAVLLDMCRANAFAPVLCVRAANFARQCDRHAIAAQICEAALARGTPSPELLIVAGHIARESGDFATARWRYLAALDAGADLRQHQVLGALANSRRYTDPADADLARFDRAYRDLALGARARASAGFALAKALGDVGDIAAAVPVLRGSNALVRSAVAWRADAWHSFVTARMRERVGRAAAMDPAAFVPVFIVGVPRSGTTLTASLLAKTSAARDRGELRALRFIAERLVAGGYLQDRAALAEAAGLYRKLAVQDDAPATWYLDQDPLNFRWLHLAAALFPQAKVAHLRRDPRDTALSLWSQDFAHPDMAFAYDFDTIAAFMAGHATLMARWKATLPVPVFELDYETLVGAPERTLATLRDFIGVPGRAAGTTSADAAPVQSASVWQARQPVYTTSVGRWRKYLPYVPELERFA